jgi:thiol-disulfide isomerase/thioredoxin/YHS domain-containing protein
MRSPLFALTLGLYLGSAFSAPVAAAELKPEAVWKTDFSAAQEEAKKLNRPLVVHFHAVWCGPCKMMERDVLHSPQVLKMLEAGFVAVKVDVGKNRAVSDRYGVTSMPTDLIVSPDGKVLGRTEGYDPAAGDRQKYISNITRIDARYAAERKQLARSTAPSEDKGKSEKEVATKPSTPVKSDHTVAATPDKLVPPPTEPKKVPEIAATSQSADAPVNVPKQDIPVAAGTGVADSSAMLLAMDGYCPVTLRATRAWKPGSSEIFFEHDGQIFFFTAAQKRDEFKANPGRFAPRHLGCDPVVLAHSDVAVRGSVKFGAFYEGELYLFESADSRAKFRKDPARYARLQHALKPEDVKKIASTAGQTVSD